ncbi:MAG: bifunctional serine/threonine-protein kinase/formylglycine-generating enzyme family protein [Candidatus Sumerlaeia bacterium]|nr:bifunctional serine/threonine-protein kinase/formylglycine-generating enzyme family protein [Candidatus Sumerlaeia bacterium]
MIQIRTARWFLPLENTKSNDTPEIKDSNEKVPLRRVRPAAQPSRSEVRLGFIRYACPKCKAVNNVELELAGQPTRCGECQEYFIVPKTPLEEGVVIGDYVLGKPMGEGAMGVVYSAWQRSLERPCALKILHEKYQSDKELASALIREAQTAAKLVHPNIVQCYAVGREDRMVYYAMEHVEGETLNNFFQRQPRLTVGAASHLIHQIASALDYSWNKFQIVHRDIKPANIMVNSQREAKLADLGLARPASVKSRINDALQRVFDEASKNPSLLSSQVYLSPELARGEEVDHRSDIFSLGAVYYRCVTGRHPFDATTPEESIRMVLEDQVREPKALLAEIPQEASDVIMKMLSKRPEERYQDYQSLMADLNLLKDTDGSSSNIALRTRLSDSQVKRPSSADFAPIKSTTVPVATKKSGGAGFLVVSVLLLLLVAGGGFAYYAMNQKKNSDSVESNTGTTTVASVAPKVAAPKEVPLTERVTKAQSVANQARENFLKLSNEAELASLLAKGDALLQSAERLQRDNKEDLALESYTQAGRQFALSAQEYVGGQLNPLTSRISPSDWLAYAPNAWSDHQSFTAEYDFAFNKSEYQNAVQALVNQLENAQDLKSESSETLLQLSEPLMNSAGFTTAEVYLTRAFQINPSNPRVNELLTLGRSTLKYKASDSYTNSIGMSFRFIPAGSFAMGSPETEIGRDEDEVQRAVELTSGYFLSETEVTWGHWKAVMGDREPSGLEGSTPIRDDVHPVSFVTWEDAVLFCTALSEREKGFRYRLPSEAEWEKACRAGTTTATHYGDVALTIREAALYDPIQILESPVPVGSIGAANAFGLKDMHGNMWEWCLDWYAPYNTAELTNPMGPLERPGSIDTSPKVARGGSWMDDPVEARSANRVSFIPVVGSGIIGFRVLLEPASITEP